MAGHPRSLEVLGSTSRTHSGTGLQDPILPLPARSSTLVLCCPLLVGAAEPTGRLGREELTPNPTTGRGEKKNKYRERSMDQQQEQREGKGGDRERESVRGAPGGERRAQE